MLQRRPTPDARDAVLAQGAALVHAAVPEASKADAMAATRALSALQMLVQLGDWAGLRRTVASTQRT